MDATTLTWRRAAGRMAANFAGDVWNGRMLKNPWSRAAHCMVQGWRIRLSRPPATGNVRVTPRPNWKAFARLAARIVATKANHGRRNAWHLWATRRVTAGSRYIPKSQRIWAMS